MTEDVSKTPEGEGTPPEPKWWVDDKIAGQGDRPEWLPEKFKSASQLAKSYSELEKAHGHVPEEYDFTHGKYIDPEYGPLKDLQELARSKKVPKEVMDKTVEVFDKYWDEFADDPKVEIEKLGENGKSRVSLLTNWAKANLTADSAKALFSSVRTAQGIKALEELRSKVMTGNSQIPNGNTDGAGSGTPTLAAIQDEMNANLEKYKTDPAYRADLQSRIARLAEAK